MRQAKLGKPSGHKGYLGDEWLSLMKAGMKPWTCPHCQTSGTGMGTANRWHFDKCKHKENK